ncbi:MAG: hypothetical protein AB7F32_04230 [Victivallaceae bacterium]
MKLSHQLLLASATAVLILGFAGRAQASSLESSFKQAISSGSLKNIRYDRITYVDGNIIVTGNVHIPFGDFDIYADRAIVNPDSRDIDAMGNIQLFRRTRMTGSVTPEELMRLENSAGNAVQITGVTTDLFGNQKIEVNITYVDSKVRAERLSGNLNTGYFQFSKAELTFGAMVGRAAEGVRKPNGIITLKDAEVSSCGYLESRNSHYSVSAKEMELTPRNTSDFTLESAEKDRDEYSVMAYGATWNIYGVPVLWLPVFYKPRGETLGLAQIQAGENGDWGYYVSLSKKFTVFDYPYTTARLLFDYYELRGYGYGTSIQSASENSKTAIFAYSIYDLRPHESTDVRNYGISTPHGRYDFRISNMTHIDPTLDFRGNFELLSDAYFTKDFFNSYYTSNPQPTTFAALEKQFDHFSASVYVRPRINNFFTTVESLPVGRIDIPRQEIFGSNVYYQGEFSIGYYQRKWQDYNQRYYFDLPNDYSSGRLDNLNMFYYPIELGWLNLIPRAGFRMTGYTSSSQKKLNQEDVDLMNYSDQPDYNDRETPQLANNSIIQGFKNGDYSYDDKGGGRFRFVGEFGLEANTKIYNSWQDVRSAFAELDGLRHVMIPYVNYTFIPKPSTSSDHLYYFDDIDRIDEQNFIRLGMVNRLQTRRNDQIVNYFTMENYWDFHFQPQQGFSNVGDFCTKLTMNPFKGLTISTFFSIAAGDGDDEVYGDGNPNNKSARQIRRNGRVISNPGLDLSWLNRWNVTVAYSPIQDVVFNVQYNYQNAYRTQSVYSMGSSLSDIESGSAFNKLYLANTQQVSFGMSIPLTPDRRTFGQYQIYYDFYAGFAPSQRFSVIRKFHCWEVAAEIDISTANKSDNGTSKKQVDTSFYVTAYLTGLITPLQEAQNTMIKQSRDFATQNSTGELR